jgi:hypothetical protein
MSHNDKVQFLRTPKGRLICGAIAFSTGVTCLVIVFIVVFFAIYGGLGVFGFNEMFKANPNVQDSGCYNFNRTLLNPTNIPLFPTPCGYPNTTVLYAGLSVPASNWSYVTFTSRRNTDSDAIDPIMNLKGIMMVSNVDSAPFVIAVHGIRGCKENTNPLIPAAMLWQAGFNVLLPDLRNHGESQLSDKYPYATFGLQEHVRYNNYLLMF